MFRLEQPPAAARLRISADATYHLWLDGRWLGHGPAQHHPHRPPVDEVDLTALLSAGPHVLAVLVHAPGIGLHNYVPSGTPGLAARLELTFSDGATQTIDTDADWRITARTGWSGDVPRRSWAIGHIECFDAAAAPGAWQELDFDDHDWRTPEQHAVNIPGWRYIDRPVPPLRYAFHAADRLTGAFTIAEPPRPISTADNSAAAGKAIMDADWAPIDPAGCVRSTSQGFTVDGLTSDRGLILCFDLGQELIGQAIFDAQCDSAGTVDIGWSEAIDNGRPLLVRKGCSYCDRIQAAPGMVRWHPIGYSAMRYLVLVLRGFTGAIHFSRLGVIASEPALDWSGGISTADTTIDPIADLCARTIRVGVQDGPVDCPTREQATYIGDGQLICRWIAMLTGDCRHWASLVDDQFARPSPQGLLRSSVYSAANDSLIDYSLLAVIGLRDYWRYSGDTERARRWVGHCRNILGFFDRLRDSRDLLAFNWQPPGGRGWEMRYDPAFPDFATKDHLNLFIDHAGMGWHNQHEAGIDRRGSNTALTALDAMTRRALAELEAAIGNEPEAARLRREADRFASAIARHCFDAQRGYFVDGVLEGRPLTQVSEQTNTWAIAAGCCDDATARDLFGRLLQSGDPAIARNGPYFWAYCFPQLARLGMYTLGLEKVKLWKPMIDAGATTLWETFAGDDLDSYCHPWSAAPLEFLLTAIAGLPLLDSAPLTLRPRPDLLKTCTASAHRIDGPITIAWRPTPAGTEITGTLPPGCSARLALPTDQAVQVEGSWRYLLPDSPGRRASS